MFMLGFRTAAAVTALLAAGGLFLAACALTLMMPADSLLYVWAAAWLAMGACGWLASIALPEIFG